MREIKHLPILVILEEINKEDSLGEFTRKWIRRFKSIESLKKEIKNPYKYGCWKLIGAFKLTDFSDKEKIELGKSFIEKIY